MLENISKPKYKWIVSKEKPLRMYNGMSEQEFDDNYLVTWNIRTGTEGIQDSVAHSYIPIDLTGKDGEYIVEVNARISSESNYDHGYAVVNQSTDMPQYDESEKFIDISGTADNENYISQILEGGKVYYLHLGYTKDGSQDTEEDQIVINSIKLYQAEKTEIKYNFIEENSTYKSTNQGKADTITKSYIPIDLSKYKGKYTLTVNVEVSSEYGDEGYAIITDTTDEYGENYYDEIFYISGEIETTDYTIEL